MKRRGSAFLIISTLLVIMIVVAISVGSVSVPLGQLIDSIFSGTGGRRYR